MATSLSLKFWNVPIFSSEYLCRYHASVDGEDVAMEILDTAGHVSMTFWLPKENVFSFGNFNFEDNKTNMWKFISIAGYRFWDIAENLEQLLPVHSERITCNWKTQSEKRNCQ